MFILKKKFKWKSFIFSGIELVLLLYFIVKYFFRLCISFMIVVYCNVMICYI